MFQFKLLDFAVFMKRKILFYSCLFHLLFFFTQVNYANGFSDIFLTPNVAFSHTLKTSAVHSFYIKAEANDFFEIVCERKGTDVGLTVYSPNSAVISNSNAPSGFAGNDILVFIAEKSGIYKVEVRSRRPGNFTGKYTIKIKTKQKAVQTDLIRFQAMKMVGSVRFAISGIDDRTPKAESAMGVLKKALLLFEEIGDLQGQAITLFHIADIYSNEYGLEKPAIEFFEKSLAIWKKLDDPANLSICLTAAANEYRLNGQNEKSESYFKQAIEINHSTNNSHGNAVVFSLLCRFYNDTGYFQKGFENCRESLKITLDTDPLTDYFTYQALGALSGNTGDMVNAEKNIYLGFERVKVVKDIINPIRFARSLGGVAGIYYQKKDYKKAIENYTSALSISEKVNRPVFTSLFLMQLGESYYLLKDYEKVIEYGERSLQLLRLHDPRRRQAALTLLGKTYGMVKQTEKARSFLFEAIAVNRQNNDRYAASECLYELSAIEKRSENLSEAHNYINQAITNMEILRADLLGKNQRSSYNSILKIYYELEIEILVKTYEKTNLIRYLEQAWQKQEKIRARSLLENFIENGLSLNKVVSNNFFIKEKQLLENVAAAENKRLEAERTKNPEVLRSAELNLQKAMDELQILQEDLRRKNPKFSALNQTKDFSFADVQNTLSNETAMLEFSVGEEQTYLWLIKKSAVNIYKLPSRETIGKTALDYYNLLTNKTADYSTIAATSKELSRMILSPLKDDIPEIKSLVVVPDGSLQLIPFSTLTLNFEADFRPLIEQFEIVSLPSFSSLAYMRENKDKIKIPAEKFLAVIADPIFHIDDERLGDKSKKPIFKADSVKDSAKLAEALRDFGIDKLSRLPFTNIEAREIQKLAPQKTTLALGENASRQRFLSGEFEAFKILHFATHGFLNQKNPDLSGLVLSLYNKNLQTQNGFLRVIDLYSVRLNAELVVLSACQTGLGKEVAGEGIIGLTHGFMFAGSARVISSLWKVEDSATAELMKRFYYEMLVNERTPTAALRSAQNQLRTIPRFKNPRYWAGFTLNGDWK